MRYGCRPVRALFLTMLMVLIGTVTAQAHNHHKTSHHAGLNSGSIARAAFEARNVICPKLASHSVDRTRAKVHQSAQPRFSDGHRCCHSPGDNARVPAGATNSRPRAKVFTDARFDCSTSKAALARSEAGLLVNGSGSTITTWRVATAPPHVLHRLLILTTGRFRI